MARGNRCGRCRDGARSRTDHYVWSKEFQHDLLQLAFDPFEPSACIVLAAGGFVYTCTGVTAERGRETVVRKYQVGDVGDANARRGSVRQITAVTGADAPAACAGSPCTALAHAVVVWSLPAVGTVGFAQCAQRPRLCFAGRSVGHV